MRFDDVSVRQYSLLDADRGPGSTVKLEVPSAAAISERRRLQNRNAQRRFRQRREQQQQQNAAEDISGGQFATPESTLSQLELQSEDTPSRFATVIKSHDNSFCYGFYLPDGTTTTTTTTPTEDIGVEEMPSPFYQFSQTSPSTCSSSSSFNLQQSPFEYIQIDPSSFTVENTTKMHHNPAPHQPGHYLSAAALPNPSFPPAPPCTALKPPSAYEYLGVLHIAAQKGHDRIVHMLLRHHGMDCNATDSEGRTPLMHAVVAGHATVVRILLDAGACYNGVDHMQRSVLHLAVLHWREHVLRLLLAEMGDTAANTHGPLGLADDRLRFLLDAYDADGNTPLHLAVMEGFEVGVGMLLQSGTDLELVARRC